jgi:hypothetical protein
MCNIYASMFASSDRRLKSDRTACTTLRQKIEERPDRLHHILTETPVAYRLSV